MLVRVPTEQIRDSINKVLSVVDKKNTRPILTYTLVTAKEDSIEFSATDLEVSSKIKISAQVETAGTFCVNAKNLSDILRELPSSILELKIEKEENTLKINCGDIHFSLLIYKNDDFPQLAFGNVDNQFKISSNQILDIIQKTNHAISNDETRVYLNGIFLQEIDSKLRAVATDGHRLSLIDTELENIHNETLVNGIIIPKKGVTELKRLAESYPENDILISMDDSFIYVQANDQYFLSIRLIAREYPKYQSVIPNKTVYNMQIDRNVLLEAVRRIKIMSNEKSNGIRIKILDKEIEISANHPSLGDAREVIPVKYTGERMEIGFNAKYLVDTLVTIDEGDISLDLNNELSPVVVKSANHPNYVGIIMPLKL